MNIIYESTKKHGATVNIRNLMVDSLVSSTVLQARARQRPPAQSRGLIIWEDAAPP
jgi:hypothetical protein